ncbi:MAG: HD domain-containing protein [Bacteroidales bacterium]|nr:HD domain-containing protein [Lentimicrobiaceae bacterium]MDD5694371.1 HD domain-containing protein [Bacteroidales bacterium]
MIDFDGARQFIINKLKNELRPELQYHNFEHTLDVLESVERLAQLEKENGHGLLLLKTAALFHDSGMLIQYGDHEEASGIITRQYLPDFGYTEQDIEIINKMILSTKLPQSAHTRLEKILCDADLDYLGRDDFYMIAHRLRYEWSQLNIFPTSLYEWYRLQLNFLIHHDYYTPSATHLRQEKKNIHLAEIRELIREG